MKKKRILYFSIVRLCRVDCTRNERYTPAYIFGIMNESSTEENTDVNVIIVLHVLLYNIDGRRPMCRAQYSHGVNNYRVLSKCIRVELIKPRFPFK